MPLPFIAPPLINTANPWASSEEDLRALFACPFTGAITTRTSLISGFEHDDAIHQYAFFDTASDVLQSNCSTRVSSLNTLGYSPLPLSEYLRIITSIAQSPSPRGTITQKPCIISVTGTSEDIMCCYQLISECQRHVKMPLCMEVNLSCPNIPHKPPPAYSRAMLKEYLEALRLARQSNAGATIAIGLKTPPYTYHDQFQILIDAMLDMDDKCPVDFISAVNTLGSSLVVADLAGTPALSSAAGTGIGGMAGAALHPLALGNVKILRSMLDQHVALRSIDIIGIGGVSDNAGLKRMMSAGATIVGVGTALGHAGIGVFETIMTAGSDQSSA